MRQFIVLLLPFLVITNKLAAQDTLTGTFKSLHLSNGSYYLKDVVTVQDSLTVAPGAKLLFTNAATLVSNGYLNMNGTSSQRIELASLPGFWGGGVVIAGQSPQMGTFMRYVSFTGLVTPLNFVGGWARKEVDVDRCQFFNNTGSGSIIQVLDPSFTIGDDSTVLPFRLTNSLIAHNRASVYFEDLVSRHLKLRVVNNTFYGNRVPGYGKYSFSGNFFYGRADNKTGNFLKPEVANNSFLNNHIWNIDVDTVVQKANVGVYGNADSIDFAGNYWDSVANDKIMEGIYDHTLNYTCPELLYLPKLAKPAGVLPPHFYAVNADSGRLVGYDAAVFPGAFPFFTLRSNTPVNTTGIKLVYHYLRDSTNTAVSDTAMLFRMESVDSVTTKITIAGDSIMRKFPGYLSIDGASGKLNEVVPEVQIGHRKFLVERYLRAKKLENEKLLRITDSLQPKPKLVPPSLTKFNKRYEIGLMAGFGLYYGTLSNRSLFQNDFNSMLGIQFRYSLQSHVSLSASMLRVTLTGSDLRSGDSTKVARGMSFKTPVTAVSFQLEYDIVDNRTYSSRNRIRPSIGFGIDYIKFNPTAEYLGKSYDLQPLGTGGQNLDGSTVPPYKLSSFGAPVSVMARYFINKKTIFSLFATYHLAFTDYIDDVGATPYPDPVKLAQANGNNGAAAAYFANPTKRVVAPGQLRSGLENGSDSFFTFGFTLAHHF